MKETIKLARYCSPRIFVRILRDTIDVSDGEPEFELSEGMATKLLIERFDSIRRAALLEAAEIAEGQSARQLDKNWSDAHLSTANAIRAAILMIVPR